MPSGVSDYGAATWLGALFGALALPTQYWIALCSREPGDAMDGTMLGELEPRNDSFYARRPYGTGADEWVSNGQYVTNTVAITFPIPHQDWGYLTHYALCSTSVGGQVYAWGEISNPQFVTNSVGMQIPPGGIVLGLHALGNSIAA